VDVGWRPDRVRLGVYRAGLISSARRRLVPVYSRGAPPSYSLPPAPTGTLNEIQLPANDVQIQTLFNAAQPGDSFIMPNTTVVFAHEPTLKVAGTATNPISLRGTAQSIFESGTGDYGLHILDAGYNQVLGGVFQNNDKGIVMDNSKHCTLRYVRVAHVGQEAIHFRASSADGLAEYCTIEATGEQNANFGEGFYVGTHDGNWTQQYYDRSSPTQVLKGVLGNEGGVDQSHRVVIQRCQIINTTGEGLDYKQGAFDVVVKDNDFYATGWSGANSADSAIDCKGDNALIENNDFYPLMPDGSMPTNPDLTLVYTQRSCIQARVLTAPYGHNHTIKSNRAHGSWEAYLFEQVSGSSGNVVYDDNTAPGAALGVANISLTPVGGSNPGDVIAGGTTWSSTGTVTATLPAGWQANDLMVATAFVRTPAAPSAPAGWTLLNSGTGASLGAAVYTRVAQAGDAAPQFTAAGASGLALGASITALHTWSGTPVAAGDYDEVPTDPTCPDIAAPAGATILRLVCLGDDLPPEAQPPGLTALGTWSTTPIGNDAAMGGWYGTQASAGQTGTLTTTYTGTDPWIAYTIAVSI
jgi:parallel beta helix pectate lyase-like protein